MKTAIIVLLITIIGLMTLVISNQQRRIDNLKQTVIRQGDAIEELQKERDNTYSGL